MWGNILLKKGLLNRNPTISCAPFTSTLYAGTATQNGTGNTSWTNLSNILGDTTGTYTNVSIVADNGTASYSNYIDVYNFGFAIPDLNVIDGIEFTFDYDGIFDPNAEAKFSTYLQLLIAGTPSGTNYGDETIFLNDALNQTYTIGGATSLFGLSPTYSDINSSTFGLRFQLFNDDKPGDSATIRIKRISCKIYAGC